MQHWIGWWSLDCCVLFWMKAGVAGTVPVSIPLFNWTIWVFRNCMSPTYNSGKDFGFRWRSEQIRFRTHWSRNFIPTAVSTGSLSHPVQHWIGWWSLDCCKIHLEEMAPLLNSSQPKSNTWLLRTRSRYTTEKSMDSKCNWCRMAQRRISWQSWRTWQHTKRNRSYKKQNRYEQKRSKRENRQPTKATRKENTTEKISNKARKKQWQSTSKYVRDQWLAKNTTTTCSSSQWIYAQH